MPKSQVRSIPSNLRTQFRPVREDFKWHEMPLQYSKKSIISTLQKSSMKNLGVGNESFQSMIETDCYYVDKTAFIRPLIASGRDVQLITRPRRFGKSLFMDTVRAFLEVNPENPGDTSRQERLFAGLDILKAKDFCDKFMGQHPVLFVSLKDVKGQNFAAALQGLAETLQPLVVRFSKLLDSPQLTPDDRIYLEQCAFREHMLDPAHRADLRIFLHKMTSILFRHYRRQVILLIDEYDVPLQKAAKEGYYKEMLDFMQGFLSPLKPGTTLDIDGTRALGKAILTGCLRISKASIFTGVNNFDVNTVCTQGGPLSAAIGFTSDEVTALLESFSLTSKQEIVRAWYDGYRIGKEEIYCPWDVIRYLSDIIADGVNREKFHPQNYWIETSSNGIIDEFLGFLTEKEANDIQTLMDGGEIEFTLNETVNYDALSAHDPDDFWTILLFTGYLTLSSGASNGASSCRVRIPNEEIKDAFGKRIQKRFSAVNDDFALSGRNFALSALNGDVASMNGILSDVLDVYVSVRDSATRSKAENFYHGFLSALLAGAGRTIRNFQSNREAGDGYADILFCSGSFPRIGVVLELKHCQKPQDLEKGALKALEQIRGKHYAKGFAGRGCQRIFGYGLAFHGKSCLIEVEPFEDSSRNDQREGLGTVGST